jgi:hypothetical protein
MKPSAYPAAVAPQWGLQMHDALHHSLQYPNYRILTLRDSGQLKQRGLS